MSLMAVAIMGAQLNEPHVALGSMLPWCARALIEPVFTLARLIVVWIPVQRVWGILQAKIQITTICDRPGPSVAFLRSAGLLDQSWQGATQQQQCPPHRQTNKHVCWHQSIVRLSQHFSDWIAIKRGAKSTGKVYLQTKISFIFEAHFAVCSRKERNSYFLLKTQNCLYR